MPVNEKELLFAPQPKTGCAANSNSVQPMESSPAAKSCTPDRPHFFALSRQQVPGQDMNSSEKELNCNLFDQLSLLEEIEEIEEEKMLKRRCFLLQKKRQVERKLYQQPPLQSE